jgi:SAM-dependent methyltransferase
MSSSRIYWFLTDSNYMMKIALLKEIQDHRLKNQGNILHFGCGSKSYLKEFAHCDSYIGVDLEVSGHNHWKSQVDIDYEGENLPWPNETFNSVNSFTVLEHLPYPAKSIIEISRVLKPNGTLLVAVPFLCGEHEIPIDFQRWTSFGKTKFFEDLGFIDIEVIKINQTPAFAIQLFVDIFMNKVKYKKSRALRIVLILIIVCSHVILFIIKSILRKTHWFYSNMLVIVKKAPFEF